MAYSGYLLKIGEYVIPFNYIQSESYKCKIYGQDIDSYDDADGITQRNALENKKIKVEFNTPSPINDKEIQPLLSALESQYINPREKSSIISAWMPEKNKYVSQKVYTPDIEFEIQYADENEVIYNKVRIAFIGYGGKI